MIVSEQSGAEWSGSERSGAATIKDFIYHSSPKKRFRIEKLTNTKREGDPFPYLVKISLYIIFLSRNNNNIVELDR